MATSTGTISLGGLLGGTAGSIDTASLVTNLVAAASVPKTQLSDQLTTLGTKITAYQAVNTKLTALQTAAQSLTKDATWRASAATSSTSAVVATSTGAASAGTTTFDVVRLARAQITTIAAAADGTVVGTAPATITITGLDGAGHDVTVSPATAAAAATAINNAGLGVRASVITTDQGVQLQLTSGKTGAANGFSVSGFSSGAKNLVAATDAQLSVGGAGGYTVSSASNTFTGVIPGVSFSVSAVASDVSITVASDANAISSAVQKLVTTMNAAHGELASDAGLGGVLQGSSDVNTIGSALVSSISRGTSAGGSLHGYGIDVDANGTVSFDAAAFAAAYGADPSGTQKAIGDLAASLNTTTTNAVDDTTGTVTTAIKSLSDTGTRLTTEIGTWTDRLANLKSQLETRFTTMQTQLARLQTTQTYLTSVLASMENSKESSS